MALRRSVTALELSALREDELDPLLAALDSLELDLRPLEYVSFHAPSRLERLSESDFVNRLQLVAARRWAIIVHPNVIHDFSLWRSLGNAVCIENMDKRKKIGRTAAQLQSIFRELPEATFCFDIGHARQVDPTMQEARAFLQCFQDRLRQVHMSYVNSQCGHERLNYECIGAFGQVAKMISRELPIILETPVSDGGLDEEVRIAQSILRQSKGITWTRRIE
jgi:hypothetical protein